MIGCNTPLAPVGHGGGALARASGLLCVLFAVLNPVPGEAQNRPSVSRSGEDALEERVARMERIVESQTLLQMLNGLEALRADINALRGQLEIQGNDLTRTQERQRELFSDMDTRLYRLEEAIAGRTPASPVAGDTPASAPVSDRELDTFQPSSPQEIPENTISLLGEGQAASPPVPIERVEQVETTQPEQAPDRVQATVSGDDPEEVVRVIRREFSRAEPPPEMPDAEPDASTGQPLDASTGQPSTGHVSTAQPLDTSTGQQLDASVAQPDASTAQADASTAQQPGASTAQPSAGAGEPPGSSTPLSEETTIQQPETLTVAALPGTEGPAISEPAIDPLQIEAEYRRAFSLMRQRHYARASDSFREFTERFPDSEYSDNAQYWLGESHYAMSEFSEAIVEYEKLIANYPESSKMTHAMLKIAYSYQALNNNEEARGRLYELIEQHPDTTASRLAQDRLERMEQLGN